jgi:hypothetical protein
MKNIDFENDDDRDDRDDGDKFWGELKDADPLETKFDPFPYLNKENIKTMETHLGDQSVDDEGELFAALAMTENRTDAEIVYAANMAKTGDCKLTVNALLMGAQMNDIRRTETLLNAFDANMADEYLRSIAYRGGSTLNDNENMTLFRDFAIYKKLFLDIREIYPDGIVEGGGATDPKEIPLTTQRKRQILQILNRHAKSSIPTFERSADGTLTTEDFNAKFLYGYFDLAYINGGLLDRSADYSNYDFLRENNIKMTPKQQKTFTAHFGPIIRSKSASANARDHDEKACGDLSLE